MIVAQHHNTQRLVTVQIVHMTCSECVQDLYNIIYDLPNQYTYAVALVCYASDTQGQSTTLLSSVSIKGVV